MVSDPAAGNGLIASKDTGGASASRSWWSKTWGEKTFDLKTYAGVALLGNEATSLLITTQAEHGIGKNWYARQMERFQALKGKKFVPAYVYEGGLFNLLLAVIGGMTVVPWIKHLEDHKNEIVRASDRAHYGEEAENDPRITAAHKTLDAEPKQTWGSLWKGRLITVFAAIGVDSMMGGEHSLSTTLFKKNTTYQKYANVDRIAAHISQGVMDTLNIAEKSRPGWDKWLKKGSWLLGLSTSLTALFYVSSKLFARKHEEKIERRAAQAGNGAVQREVSDDEPLPERAATHETPQSQVSSIARENTLAAAPEPAQIMA